MARTFNTLIIGAGRMGAFYDSPKNKDRVLTHAHAFTKHKGFNLVGFYDIDSSKSMMAAKRWGTKNYKSIAQAFHDNDIDVVSVAVPDKQHYSTLKTILRYRPRLVFVEKPLTNGSHSASKIVKLYKKYRIPLLVNYSRRFVPEFLNEREKMQKGQYGKFLGGVGYYGKGILHNGSHMVDTLRFLLGEVKVEKVLDGEPDFGNDPSVTAILNINSSKFFMKHINSSHYTIFEIDLFFEKARIRILNSGFKIEKHQVKKNPTYQKYFDMVKDKEVSTELGMSCYRAVENINSFLNRKSQLACDGDDALQDLRICLAISKKTKINKKVILYSHDPGGANMIIPLVKPLKERGYKVTIYGESYSLPKYKEFGLKGEDIAKKIRKISLNAVENFLKEDSPDFVITGTSVGSMTERYLWQAAKELNVPSFAMLDTWVNYDKRFSSNIKSSYYFPTKICVVDNAAKEKVFIEGLTEDMLITTGSPYFEFLMQKNSATIKQNVKKNTTLKNRSTLNFLFISEPISKFYRQNFGSESYLGFTEKTILKDVYRSISEVFGDKAAKIKILIKLHPKDDISTYTKTIRILKPKANIHIEIIKNGQLSNWKAINSADVVIGMGSTLLIEAFLLRKPVLDVRIGLKKDYPSMFDKAGMMKTIHSYSELVRRLTRLVENQSVPKYNNVIIDKPIEKIVSEMEKILWRS